MKSQTGNPIRARVLAEKISKLMRKKETVDVGTAIALYTVGMLARAVPYFYLPIC
jgi:hypothetical protein